jgi:hypothetical protein
LTYFRTALLLQLERSRVAAAGAQVC